MATWEKLLMFDSCGLIVNGAVNVQGVQQALLNAGFQIGKVDGVAGPQTKKMLVAFQKSKGLRGDGVIGIQTLRLLAEHLEEHSESAVDK